MTTNTDVPKKPKRVRDPTPDDYVQQRMIVLLTSNRNRKLNKILNKLINDAVDSGDVELMKLILTTAQGHGRTSKLKAAALSQPTTPIATTPAAPQDLMSRLRVTGAQSAPLALNGSESL